ncbi:hypothetical protein [Rhizobium acidisoli]|uniref:hypothetical protein n=1 Tax=Rhizobium acidisoli TaxID=1538158 RepID=UPI0013E8AF0B|nr:hypothetical protein [Rhizobium acidisoli]
MSEALKTGLLQGIIILVSGVQIPTPLPTLIADFGDFAACFEPVPAAVAVHQSQRNRRAAGKVGQLPICGISAGAEDRTIASEAILAASSSKGEMRQR